MGLFMEIRSKEAEGLFAAAYGLMEKHSVAFRRRLEHLRTYGCPVGLNTGRGRVAMFGWTQLVQQTLALDLLNIGLPPERAAHLTVGDPTAVQLHSWLLITAPVTQAEVVSWVSKSMWPTHRSLMLLARPGEVFAIHENASADYHFTAVYGRDLATWNAERNETTTSGIVVDFGLLIAGLISRVAAWTGASPVEVTMSFFKWAESYDVCS
jgi:hypothetical protein